jgi:multidrug efflux pump subunit AcrA (membrane-fusion protein)
MKTNSKHWLLLLAVPILGVIGYFLWRSSPDQLSESNRHKVLFYQDSMHPWIKSDQPGKCTICAMDLTPIYEATKGFGISENLVVLSSNSITVLNVQTEEVKRQTLSRTLRVAGTLEANETLKTIVSAPSPGRIQALAVEFAGVEVEKGQTLITLFSPDLVQKRSYLRAVGGNQSSVGSGLLQATLNSDPYSGDLLAPQSGVVVERNVYSGQYVAEGEKLLTIVDASILWFRFDIYEQQLPWFKLGQPIEVTTRAVPGKRFSTVITFIEPSLNDATRTIKVRADIKNPVVTTNGHPQRLLRFGMYAEGQVRAEIPNTLAIPRTAILFPGGAAFAYVDKGNGAYERRRVKLGRQGDGLWEVLNGLEEGDRVVTSGNVLIDAQAQFNQGNRFDLADADAVASDEPEGGQPGAEAVVIHSTHAEVASTKRVPEPESAQVRTNKILTYREADYARLAIRDEMWKMRMAAIAEARAQESASTNQLTSSQRQAIEAFITAADGVSRALAADNLEQSNRQINNLPSVLPALQKEFGTGHRWSGLIQRLVTVSKWPPVKDLTEARKQFLPFSTAAVEWLKQVRKEDPSFAQLKIYHCPMAPKPGLWMQAKGPLANPFYGAKMLECGEEVLD